MNTEKNDTLISKFIGWEYFKSSKYSEEQWGSHSHFESCSVWILNPTKLYRENPCHYGYSYLDGEYNSSISKEDLFTDYAYNLQFDTSWDWLMPVLEKIESLPCINVYISKSMLSKEHSVEITYEKYPLYKKELNKTIFIRNESKIQAVYEALVEFLEWYNTHKNG